MKLRLLILNCFLFSLISVAQTPISYTVNITSLPTCSTCCNGAVCVTLPTGGCNGPYTYSFSSSSVGPNACANNFCYNTTYSVKVFDVCDTTTKNFTFPVFTSISEHIKVNDLQIYPNPTNEKLTIAFQNFTQTNTQVYVLNSFGQYIKQFNLSVQINEINVNELNSGIYLLYINSNGTQKLFKFIKQ